MSKNTMILAIAVAISSAFPAARAVEPRLKIDTIVNALPGSIVLGLPAEPLTVIGPESSYTVSRISSFPHATIGVGTQLDNIYVDASAGLGLFLNSSFTSIVLSMNISADFAVRRALTIGPHAGLLWFVYTNWDGTGYVDVRGTLGLMAGVHMTMGERIAYEMSIDIVAASLGLDPGTSWATSESQLDLSGLAIQFGLQRKF